jgi:hypothetical protein
MMPDWFHETFLKGHDTRFDIIGLRLALSFLLGVLVAAIYQLTQRKPRTEAAPFVTTLVLLTILIAMVTLIIGDNTARAFSLVGALAIIRFRTVVEDTRDTAFVIFAVVVGMGAGAGYLAVVVMGIPIVAFAAVLLSQWGRPSDVESREGTLSIRVGLGHDPDKLLGDLFAEYLDHSELTSTATARQGAALDLTYAIRFQPRNSLLAFVNALNKIEGVQNVEVKR